MLILGDKTFQLVHSAYLGSRGALAFFRDVLRSDGSLASEVACES